MTTVFKHDSSKVIGLATNMKKDANGISFEMECSIDGMPVGSLADMSFGFTGAPGDLSPEVTLPSSEEIRDSKINRRAAIAHAKENA
jgi:hypothetical protein